VSAESKSLEEITEDAIRVLYRELGVVNATRFLSQFSVGGGDYTSERDSIYADATLDALIAQIKQRRSPEQHTTGKERLEGLKKKYVRAYERWTDDEDEELRFLFSRDTSVSDLAAHFGRQPSAIRSRLRKLNLVKSD
jgi:hypothetical protein